MCINKAHERGEKLELLQRVSAALFSMDTDGALNHLTTKGRKPTGADRRQTFSKKIENYKTKKTKIFRFWLGGAAPETPWFLAGGAKPSQTPTP